MYQAVGLTDKGVQREINEDALWLPDAAQQSARALAHWGALYIVADGMGGHQAGEVASGMATTLIPRVFYADPDVDRVSALRRAVQSANMEIWQLAQRDSAYAKMGSTLVVALIQADSVTIAHAGDSRAYLWHRGQLLHLTEDHTWVNERRREGILTPEEASQHPLRHIITRSLGEKPQVELSLEIYTLKPGDLLMLCSDGLSGVVSEMQMAQLLSDLPPGQAAAALVRAANVSGGPDNITVILVPIVSASDARQPSTIGNPVGSTVRHARLPLIVFLVGMSLVCVLGVLATSGLRKAIFDFPSSATPTAKHLPPTPSATATPYPTATPQPTPAPLATPPLDYLGKSFYLAAVPDHPDLYQQKELSWMKTLWGWPFDFPGFRIQNSCWLPKGPYSIILITEVDDEIWDKQTFTVGQTYRVNLETRIPEARQNVKPLLDTAYVQARIWGNLLNTDVNAFRIELRRSASESWMPVYELVADKGFEGWVFAQQPVWDDLRKDLGLSVIGCGDPNNWTLAYLETQSGEQEITVVESYCLHNVMTCP